VTSPIPFNARLIESFSGMFLSPMYDDAKPTPAFHREGWALYSSNAPYASIAAPRDHAKSTAFTHDFILAAVLFRWEPHVLLVSASEELAQGHLGDISAVLHESDEIREEFGITSFPVDAKGEIIVTCSDNYQFRIIARGTQQRVRGMKWHGRRPGLIDCDDMEEDEQVENKEVRRKFARWVNRALIPAGRRGARVRWHGTILHVDSYLARTMKSPSWKSLFYRAHRGFDDFSEVLWPERWSADALRERRQLFLDDNDAAGYSQEYLNNPLDSGEAYLRVEWFLPMELADFARPKLKGVGVDFAISKKDQANRTSFSIGGQSSDGVLHFVDQRVGRWDGLEIVDKFFEIEEEHHPEFWWVEYGQIWLSIKAMLNKEMLRRRKFLNIIERKPLTDKAARGRSLQRRMRAGGTRWDRNAHWFPGMEDELLRFTPEAEATLDDQFDSAALLSLGFDDISDAEEEDFESEEDLDFRRSDPRLDEGRNPVTGY